MKIAQVRARTVRVPLARPAEIARRRLPERYYTIVRAVTDGGVEGLGFCLGGPTVTLFIRSLLADLVTGQDPFDTERLWDEMYQAILLLGRRGAGIRALSALDIALWDIKARASNVPLWKFMGGHCDHVPAYASGGYFLTGKTAADLADECGAYVEAGFHAVKIKIGAVPLTEDVERVRAVREAIGPRALLMLDANNAWRDAATAIRAIRKLEPYDLEWIEEPLSPDDVDGHRRITEAIDVPVATGEIEATRWGFLPLFERHAADIVQADAAVAGGITEWLKIAHTAASFGVPLAPHWFADLHVHCVAAVQNATWVEYFVGTEILNFGKLLRTRLDVRDGFITAPALPGLGIELEPLAVDHFALDPWQ